MVLTDSKAALAALLLLCSAASASAQFGLSFTYVANSATGLSGNALSCAQGGGNALFSNPGALALRSLREPAARPSRSLRLQSF